MQTVSSSDSCSEAIIRVSPVCMYPCKLPACEDSKVPLLCFSFGVQTYIHSMPVYEAPNNNTTNSLNTAGPSAAGSDERACQNPVYGAPRDLQDESNNTIPA